MLSPHDMIIYVPLECKMYNLHPKHFELSKLRIYKQEGTDLYVVDLWKRGFWAGKHFLPLPMVEHYVNVYGLVEE